MLKKPDNTKWKPTKLDYYIHERMRLKKALEDLEIKSRRSGDFLQGTLTKIKIKHEKKIQELEHKIQLEKMKQP